MLGKYAHLDAATADRYLCADLADTTKLPESLLVKLKEMWNKRTPPFFDKVHPQRDALERAHMAELVRSLGVHSSILANSVARVITVHGPADFETFIHGYAALHSRTLKEALPFAFKVFDIDQDGLIGPNEFKNVLQANLAFKELDDAAIGRVLAAQALSEGDGLSFDSFIYFASLSSETILATCGFMLHVNAFYVPPIPFGPEDNNEQSSAPANVDEKVDAEGMRVGGGKDVTENIFESEDFLSALESLRTTPEERAERCKDAGNEALRSGKSGLEFAVKQYTEGLSEQPQDRVLRAQLFSNRAAAQLMRCNWGFALEDAKSAISETLLPDMSRLRTARRGCTAALRLAKLRDAEHMLAVADKILGTVEGGSIDSGNSPATSSEAVQVQQLRVKLDSAIREEAQMNAMKQEKKLEQEQLTRVLKKRGIALGDFPDSQMRDQYIGGNSGARIWFDPEQGEMHWPMLFLYPEHQMSDFIQDASEFSSLHDHFVEMFGMEGESAPGWDIERAYRAGALCAYLCFEEDEEIECFALRTDVTLEKLLSHACKMGYCVPGIPMVTVVVANSEYERVFLKKLGSVPRIIP